MSDEPEVPEATPADADGEEIAMGDPWDEPTAIVGPWDGDAAASAAIAEALGDVGATTLEGFTEDADIARVVMIGATAWISATTELAEYLYAQEPELRAFGVTTLYAETGNRSVGVQLWELETDDAGTLIYADDAGEADVDLDAAEAAAAWEIRLAADAVDADPDADYPARMIFYRPPLAT